MKSNFEKVEPTGFVSQLNDGQIEVISDIFSRREALLMGEEGGQGVDYSAEWLLGHAFQLGAKFYRDFVTAAQQFNTGVKQ